MSFCGEERVHGGADAFPGGVPRLDFSVNLNPYGPCPEVVEAVRSADLVRYPDLHARAARAAWADQLSVPVEQIAVGHGAADLFWAVGRAFLREGSRVVIAEPTFSELRVLSHAMGARVERVFAGPLGELDLSSLARHGRGAQLLYLCSPNNPTGSAVRPDALRALADALSDTPVVLDQSFLSLSCVADDLHARLPANVVCVRSLTKDFALAGLRIGYLVAQAPWVERIERARPTWATGAPAQAAIREAARQQGFVRESYARLLADRAYLVERLSERGFAPRPSCTVFVLVPVADAPAAHARLLAEGCAVRDCSSFGLPRHIRIAVRPRADTDLLLRAVDRALQGASPLIDRA